MREETTPEGIPIPDFMPWYPRRARSGGWTVAVQRAFIAELTRIGCVGAAARAVGKSKRSAYLLREKEGAESFAAAWEAALSTGRDHARSVAIERALHGEIVPQFRNGRFTGYQTRYNDRLLIAAIAGGQRAALVHDEQHQLFEMLHRLGRWEEALRSEQMKLSGALPDSETDRDEAWEDHRVWMQETKREARRQRSAKIRAAVRRGMASPKPDGPSVRAL